MLKILIIDDDPAFCKVLEALLKEEGFYVRSAHDGREGLNVLRQEGGWVILLDLMMPLLDGYAVLQTLQSDRVLLDGNKVVVMSAATPLSHESHLKAALAPVFLPKPFDLDDLLEVVNRLVLSAV